ncbi:MAG: hypothetical protein ACRCXC_10095 [Legionella sp.]
MHHWITVQHELKGLEQPKAHEKLKSLPPAPPPRHSESSDHQLPIDSENESTLCHYSTHYSFYLEPMNQYPNLPQPLTLPPSPPNQIAPFRMQPQESSANALYT